VVDVVDPLVVLDVLNVVDAVVGPLVVVVAVGPLVGVAVGPLVGVSSCAVGLVGESPHAARRSNPAAAAMTARRRRAKRRPTAVDRDTAPA